MLSIHSASQSIVSASADYFQVDSQCCLVSEGCVICGDVVWEGTSDRNSHSVTLAIHRPWVIAAMCNFRQTSTFLYGSLI